MLNDRSKEVVRVVRNYLNKHKISHTIFDITKTVREYTDDIVKHKDVREFFLSEFANENITNWNVNVVSLSNNACPNVYFHINAVDNSYDKDQVFDYDELAAEIELLPEENNNDSDADTIDSLANSNVVFSSISNNSGTSAASSSSSVSLSSRGRLNIPRTFIDSIKGSSNVINIMHDIDNHSLVLSPNFNSNCVLLSKQTVDKSGNIRVSNSVLRKLNNKTSSFSVASVNGVVTVS